MPRRIATVLLVVLIVIFYGYRCVQKKFIAPHFVDTVEALPATNEMIVDNEFLMLMDEGDESYVNEVLKEFELELIAPLGEWLHVARRGHVGEHKIIARSALSQANNDFVIRLQENTYVHNVKLNFVQNNDSFFSCDGGKNLSSSSEDSQPSDPYFPFQWHLSSKTGINLPGAWRLSTGNPDTMIALVDRYFLSAEADLSIDQCAGRKYFYENILDYFPKAKSPNINVSTMHGSQVLSVVAPCTDNAIGLAGVDWRAQVFLVDSKENASFAARMFGLLWAAGFDVCSKSIVGCPSQHSFQKNQHPANIINASFGFANSWLKDPPYGPVLDVIGRINHQGRIVIASAGNETQIADRRLPGAAGGVISVAASNEKRESAWFSNFGRTVDVYAPGEGIIGLKHGQPITLNGTSFSAPIITGLSALMLAVNPMLAWKHIEYIFHTTSRLMSCNELCPPSFKTAQKICRDYCCVGEKNICGGHIVDAEAAVTMAQQGIPNVALIDIDDYYLALSDDNALTTKVYVKNWGKKPAIARMKKTDPHLKLWPEQFSIPPIDNHGLPGLVEATVFYDVIPEHHIVTSLIIEGANSDDPHKIHDRIEGIVEIVPDPKTNPKKILHELQ